MSKKYKLAFDKGTAENTAVRKGTEAKKLNDSLKTILNFFDEELTEEEIRSLKSYKDIVDRFRPDFPFPKASEERNFELMGKDTSGLLEASKTLRFLNDDYILKDGKVEICPKWFDDNIESYTKRTQTDAEDAAFEYATKLAKLMREGLDKGYLSEGMRIRTFHDLDLFYLLEDSHEIRGMEIVEAGKRVDKLATQLQPK